MTTPTSSAAAALLIALAAGPCHSQSDDPARSNPFANGGLAASPEPGLTVPPADAGTAPRARASSAAIREGVILNSVPGYFVRSLREPGLLVFRFDETRGAAAGRALFAMPCDPTDDVKAILADPRIDGPSRFEVSGEVYEFDDRAYLLPSAIVALRSPPPPGMLARTPPRELVPPPAPEEGPLPPRVDAYLVTTADGVVSLARDPGTGTRMSHEPDPTAFPGLDDGFADDLERRLDAGIASSGTGTALKRAQGEHDRRMLLPPATRFQERRASVLRDPVTGVWRARIDTGRPGTGTHDGAEASMEILPSLALEGLVRGVRQAAIGAPWLLSGEVVVAKDRNYLLLTRARPMPTDRFLGP
jgi:hypothetical protein